MRVFGRRISLRLLIACAVAALFAAPAHAFFFPPKPPIKVPTFPTTGGGGTHTGGTGGGGTGGGNTAGGGTTSKGGTGGTTTPQTAPEPTSMILALLASGGLSLFAACRRRGK